MNCSIKLVVLGLLALTACQTYTDHTRSVRQSVYNYNYDAAIEKLEKSPIANSQSDKVIFHLERGYIHYLNHNYDAAIQDFEAAQRQMDYLYSTSISKTTASLAVNDAVQDYEGETHEKVLNAVYTVFALWAKGDINNAISVGKRINQILTDINRNNEGKNIYSKDALGYFLSGLMFEYRQDWDNARIEYQNALNAYDNSQNWLNINPAPIVQALGRLLEYRGNTREAERLKSRYPGITWMKQQEFMKHAEVIVIYESGKAPLKISRDTWHNNPSGNVRIAIPDYERQWYLGRTASVYINNQYAGNTTVIQNVGDTAIQSLKDAMPKIIAKSLARVMVKGATTAAAGELGKKAGGEALGALAKAGTAIFNLASEVADTRHWSTLPDTIQILRMPVKPGEVVVRINPERGKPVEKTYKLNAGEKAFLHTRTFE